MEPKRSWWQKIKKYPVRSVLIVFLAVVIVLIILSVLGYIFNWDWTGLGPYVSPPHSKDSDFQRGKTLWDWLNLLGILAIPIVVGFGVAWYTSQQGKVADAENKDNQRENAFQTYIDKMSEFLLKEHLQESEIEHEILRNIARIQTLTVLPRLDGRRKGSVLQFLYDADLINNDKTIIDLKGADIRGAILSNAFLNGVRLQHVDLSGADLSGADLSGADLSGADLQNANLTGANLTNTWLSKLVEFVEQENGRTVNVDEANLNKANLKGVIGISNEELEKQTSFLKGATMPRGDIHE